MFLKPVEFVNFGDDKDAFSALAQGLESVSQNHGFLTAMYENFVTQNFTNVFGITMLHRLNLKFTNGTYRGTQEESDIMNRKLLVRLQFANAVDEFVKHGENCHGHYDHCAKHGGNCVGHCDHCSGHGRDEEICTKRIAAQVAWTNNFKKSIQRQNDTLAYPGALHECGHYCNHPGCQHGVSCGYHRECSHCEMGHR